MDSIKQTKLSHLKVCELCKRHDPMVKNYSEDFDLQTAVRDYVQKTTGEKINVGDIAHLCDSCYGDVNTTQEETEE